MPKKSRNRTLKLIADQVLKYCFMKGCNASNSRKYKTSAENLCLKNINEKLKHNQERYLFCDLHINMQSRSSSVVPFRFPACRAEGMF